MRVRVGVIGVGNMGTAHCKWLLDHPQLVLTAVADVIESRRAPWTADPAVQVFESGQALIRSGACAAVIVATPHFSHVALASAALKAGLHVLVEKPVAAEIKDAEQLLKVPKADGQILALMFNQRTNPAYGAIRDWVKNETFGPLRRMNWVITDWFRAQSYFDSGDWRATWRGEGGGALLNQAPHQLDLLCWIFGRPNHVFANCGFGRWHSIGVEDEVSAILGFEGGVTGTFVTSTGEAPGRNRLEVVLDRATLVYDTREDVILIEETSIPISEAIQNNKAFQKPKTELRRFEVAGQGGQHQAVLDNFGEAIVSGAKLLAPGAEGLDSLMLANALTLSGALEQKIELPLSAARYRRWLFSKQRAEQPRSQPVVAALNDLSGSF
ncbi:MAG: Gfo/Idh/MocA family oxidoreductase [Pseudomonadales bacterium]|nr:Gfo/Idh/MocA family oxidoreductase [Pseudomonadales bacterium]